MSEAPFVTVIMPVRNEADFIAHSLGAVLAQDYPHERIQVLVADGMSQDHTRQIIKQLAQATDVEISIIDNPGLIVPTGFNAAMQQARGDVIVRVDGHCEIAEDYISKCVQHLAEGTLAGVGGPIETVSSTRVGETIALAMSSSFGVGGSGFRTVKDRTMFVDTIAFPAYTRSAIEKAGPLDETLVRNQDDEFNYRLRSMGYRLLLSPDIRSRYYGRSSLTKLWRQYYQYGFYKVRVMQKHPRQMRPRQFAPLLLVSVVFGGALLSPVHRWLRVLWIAILCMYGLANITASVLTARRAGWQHLPLLPLVFIILHFAYGFGFLEGILRSKNNTDK